MKEKLIQKKGITLIALVITIIVLLILAGVSIATLTGQNGLLFKAEDAKNMSIISKEEEIIKLSVTDSRLNNEEQRLEQEEFQRIINNYVDTGKAEVLDEGEEFLVYFTNTEHFYRVTKDGNIQKVDNIQIVKDPYPGDITKDLEGNTLTGKENSPYEINCVEDLVNFSNLVNSGKNFLDEYIILNQSLNIASDLSYANPNDTELFGDYNGDGMIEGIKKELIKEEANGFKSISEFSGTFLGNNKEIKNIYMKEDSDIGGFFKTSNGNIENLKVSGNLKYKVESMLSRFNCIGGIVGLNEGNIINSTNEINIEINIESGENTLYCAGISAANDGGNIENCYNNGSITIKSKSAHVDIRAGGVVGRLESQHAVKNCHNEAPIYIEGEEYVLVGGVAGDIYSESAVEQCSNSGKIEAKTSSRIWMGGVVCSSAGKGRVINSCSTGDMSATSKIPRVGGIISSMVDDDTISNCYYSGIINIQSNATIGLIGGISGEIKEGNPLIENSYSIAEINGNDCNVGLILGFGRAGRIENCYALEKEGKDLIGEEESIINKNKVEVKTSDFMKQDEFVVLLNSKEESYKRDEKNQNQGYPILNWQ